MEQITSSYNLFVDSSTGHNAQTKGDDYIVNLQDAGVHAGEGEFIRMTLNNFSMAKVFQDINETNNKFKFIYTDNQNPPVTTSLDLTLDKGNYASISELAKNMGEKIRDAVIANQPGGLQANAVAVGANIGRNNIIEFTINFTDNTQNPPAAGNHGITNAIIQFNSDDGDSYVILGGDRVKTGDNATNSVANVDVSDPNLIKVTSKYPAQRASMPFVYIRAPGTLNTNIESQGLRNSADNHNSDVAHSDILGRAVVESSEWVQFTAQTDRDFFNKSTNPGLCKHRRDESKHWYLVDTTWVTSRFTQDAYKLAFFHFLLSHGNVPVITPEANTLLVKEQLDENDDFLPKLQQYFVITKDPNDKVSHLELQRYFSDMPVRVLNGHLKRLGIEYDKNGMTNSIRKVYRGIRKYNQAELLEINGDDDPE